MKQLTRLFSALANRLPIAKKLNHRVPYEHTHVQLAKLVRAHRLGEFTLGLYQSNSREAPDHVTRQVLRSRSTGGDDFEAVSWTVKPVTYEEIESFAASASHRTGCGHLLALSDQAGNIVLSEFVDEEQARRTMDSADRAGCPSLMDDGWNPLNPHSAEFVTSYPLTREEVRLLAVHWAVLGCANTAFCSETGQSGSTEIRVARYTNERSAAAAAVLGMRELNAVVAQAKTIWDKFGDDGWAAFDRPPDEPSKAS